MKIKIIAITSLLASCTNHVHIDPYAKGAISIEKAKAVRESILSAPEYLKVSKIDERQFYFYLCEESELLENGERTNCSIKVWLGDSKTNECATVVLVKEENHSFILFEGITLCR